MAATTCRLVDAGIDYLTVTAAPGGTASDLIEVGYETSMEVFEGDEWEPASWGASGYRGEKRGTIGYGSSEQGSIVQSSGAASHVLAQRLADAGLHVRCSRIDFQVTGQWSRDCPAYARRLAAHLSKAEISPSQGRPPKLESINGWGHGDTLLSGSRSSERYIRIYDKSREQRGLVDKNLWRWEVELKRRLAVNAWALVIGSTLTPDLAEGVVIHEVERRGVSIPWEKGESVEVITTRALKPDAIRKLTWIRDQVMPTFVWLYKRGYGDTLESLILEAKLRSEESAGTSSEPGQGSENT